MRAQMLGMMILLGSSLLACGNDSAPSNEASAVDENVSKDVLVEEHDTGSVAWDIKPDGQVKAVVTSSDGKPIRENLSGTLTFKGEAEAEAKPVTLTLDEKAGALVATGPKLEADLTEIGYALEVEGKPWKGTLHVPAGGTAELIANAKAAASVDVPEGKLGPHGGVIQVVGEHRVEVVCNVETGEVRIYILDANFEAVTAADFKAKLAVVADAPEVVVMLPEPKASAYLVGKLDARVEPIKVTLALTAKGITHVALVGFKAGARVVVGVKAPKVKIMVKTDWGVPDFDIDAHVKGGVKVKVKAPDVHVKVKAPDVKVKVPSVDAKAGVKVSGPKVKAKAGVKF